MDYKEKYENALERMKSWANGEHPECFTEAQKAAEFIFPELKESEDEKIRKYLLKLAERCPENSIDFMNEIKKGDVIAWLEKQGEQKPAWNKEDEEELYLTISLLDKFKEEAYTNDCENCINWIKSLKPQPHWKPTEEQMEGM